MTFKVRDARLGDKSFIFSTWLLGLYHGNDWFKEIDKGIYFSTYKLIVEHLLINSRVMVACLPDDEDVVLGYIVFKENVIHWIFVKKPWRKLGIAKLLFPSGITVCTHLTKAGKAIKPKNISFNPFFI